MTPGLRRVGGCVLSGFLLMGCTGSPSGSSSGPATAPTLPAATSQDPGSTQTPVPNPPESTRPPVKVTKPGTAEGVEVRVVALKAITAKARMPGEVAGPAVSVTVRVTNRGEKPLDVSTVAVTLYDSKKAPGGLMSASPAHPLTGKIAPKSRAEGVYVFTVPRNRRSPVTIHVTVPDAPVLVFRGNAPKG